MQSYVVDVGAKGFGDIASRLVTGLTEVFLLVEDEMLGAGNDTSVLDTFYGLGNGNTTEDRIRAEAWGALAQ